MVIFTHKGYHKLIELAAFGRNLCPLWNKYMYLTMNFSAKVKPKINPSPFRPILKASNATYLLDLSFSFPPSSLPRGGKEWCGSYSHSRGRTFNLWVLTQTVYLVIVNLFWYAQVARYPLFQQFSYCISLCIWYGQCVSPTGKVVWHY